VWPKRLARITSWYSSTKSKKLVEIQYDGGYSIMEEENERQDDKRRRRERRREERNGRGVHSSIR